MNSFSSGKKSMFHASSPSALSHIQTASRIKPSSETKGPITDGMAPAEPPQSGPEPRLLGRTKSPDALTKCKKLYHRKYVPLEK